LRPQRIASLILAAGLLAGCTPGRTAEPGPGPATWTNPVAFCGYLERPAVVSAIAAYLSTGGPADTGTLRCGDARDGGPLSRGGRFSYEGRSDPSVVVWMDILGGGLPDKTPASEKRIDDGTDPTLRVWCGVEGGQLAGEVNAFRVVPADTLPVDMTGSQQLVVTIQIHRYPSGSCGAGWTLFKDLTAAGALDEKQFARA
jgi:hypothetical protein